MRMSRSVSIRDFSARKINSISTSGVSHSRATGDRLVAPELSDSGLDAPQLARSWPRRLGPANQPSSLDGVNPFRLTEGIPDGDAKPAQIGIVVARYELADGRDGFVVARLARQSYDPEPPVGGRGIYRSALFSLKVSGKNSPEKTSHAILIAAARRVRFAKIRHRPFSWGGPLMRAQPARLWALFLYCHASWRLTGSSLTRLLNRRERSPYQSTANGMPQIRPIGVAGVLGQNDPPTDGMRGMIEGRLGRRTGVSRKRRMHYVGRKCLLLGIGGRSIRKRLIRLLVAAGALVASFLVIRVPIEGLPPNSRLEAESFAVPTSCAFRLGLAVGWGTWSANEPSVGNAPDVSVGAGCGETGVGS